MLQIALSDPSALLVSNCLLKIKMFVTQPAIAEEQTE